MKRRPASLDRRHFVALAGGAFGAAVSHAAWEKDGVPRVDAARLQQTLEQLSTFGRPAGGSFADGVSRNAYTDADIAGRDYAIGLMRDAGLDPCIDAAGSLIGRRAGKIKSAKPIMFGSHIDSVPSGGNFDGPVGSMSAIEVVRTLNDHKLTTRHPLEVALWTNEEGGTVGSAAMLGLLDEQSLQRDFYGISMRDGIRKIGGDPDRLASVRREPGTIRCYLELHIEQGGSLEKAGIPIGIVDGIVGIDHWEVEVLGFANHAGTTHMDSRRDALLAAGQIVEAVREVATRIPGNQVGTVGRLNVFPNAPNVIPGRVTLIVEFRDLSPDVIERMGAEMRERTQLIARQTGTDISVKRIENLQPALADPAIQLHIQTAADALGLKTVHLPSGAGHDAQHLAKITPMGMIFVPSIGGISHSPKEFSRWEDVANGANVLLRTLLSIDRS